MHTSPNGTSLDHASRLSSGPAGSFSDFLQRIRGGDAQAAVELVKKYEAAIRLEVRLRLRNSRLRRVLDSLDICQAVFASFFVRAAAGQFELEQPTQLMKLLCAITRNKVAYQARREQAQRRDNRRVEVVDLDGLASAKRPSPSRQASVAELLREFRQRLTRAEQFLVDMRAEGNSWDEIAARLGGTAEARRMQWNRAVNRVIQQLGLEEERNA